MLRHSRPISPQFPLSKRIALNQFVNLRLPGGHFGRQGSGGRLITCSQGREGKMWLAHEPEQNCAEVFLYLAFLLSADLPATRSRRRRSASPLRRQGSLRRRPRAPPAKVIATSALWSTCWARGALMDVSSAVSRSRTATSPPEARSCRVVSPHGTNGGGLRLTSMASHPQYLTPPRSGDRPQPANINRLRRVWRSPSHRGEAANAGLAR